MGLTLAGATRLIHDGSPSLQTGPAVVDSGRSLSSSSGSMRTDPMSSSTPTSTMSADH